MKGLFAIFVVVSLLSVGCSFNSYDKTITDIKITEYRKPDSLHVINEDSVVANTLWQDYYYDNNLRNLIDSALMRNKLLYNAILQVEKANEYVKRSKGEYFPNINLTLYQDQAKVSRINYPYNTHGVGLAVTDWEIDLWGRLKGSKRAKYAALMREQSVMQGVKVSLIANVASLYYRLVGLDAKLKAIDEMIEVDEAYLADLEYRYKSRSTNKESVGLSAGTVNRGTIAIEQAKAELYKAKSIKPKIEKDIFVTENAINLLLSRSEGDIQRSSLDVIMSNEEWNDTIFIGVPSDLIRFRPDVMAAEYAVVEEFSMKDVARSSMYPKLTLRANIATEENVYGSWNDFSTSIIYNLFAGLTQPIFRKGALKQEKRLRELSSNQKVAEFQQTVLSACFDVSNTLMGYKTDREIFVSLSKRYDSLFKAYTYSRQLNRTGRTDYIDVLAAQSQLLQTRLDLSDALISYYTQRITLYKALGGGALY